MRFVGLTYRFLEDMMADTKAALLTPTDLNRNDTKSVADALNSALADCFALYFKTKNFHWHVSGPHFRDYHLLLDDQAAQIYGVTDAIAERVRKTGNVTIRSVGDIARRQTVKDNADASKIIDAVVAIAAPQRPSIGISTTDSATFSASVSA